VTASLSRDDVLAALVAGDRSRAQLAESLDVPASSASLAVLLNALVCDDLLCMEVVDAQWHYKPTRKGRNAVGRVAA
jgi:hypothetical protein